MEFKVKRSPEPTIEIAPLIDVVFLLLLFFMVTTQFTSFPGLKMILPGIEPGATVTAADKLEIQITSVGDIFLGGAPVALERLTDELQKSALSPESAVVVLAADEKALHGRVVEVMDCIRRAGFKRAVMAAQWKRLEK
ncbi:MAG: biopolymer transporter ExbD [Pseudomonadota bacterium]